MELSGIHAAIIREFITETDFAVKYLAGHGDYFYGLDKVLQEVPMTVIDLKTDLSPLAPFSTVLKYSEMTDDFFDDFCYFPQKKSVKSYFRDGVCGKRYDIFVEDNLNFEIKTFRQTLISMIEENSSGRFLILNAQELSEEAVVILKDVERANLQCTFIFCFDTCCKDDYSSYIKLFFQQKDADLNFLDISEAYEETEGDDMLEKSVSKFNSVKTYDEIYRIFRNNRLFAVLSESCKFADWVSDRINSYSLNENELRNIYYEIGLAYFYSGNIDLAIEYFEKSLVYVNNDDFVAGVYVFLSKAYLLKRNLQKASECTYQAVQICERLNEHNWYPLALMMEYQAVNISNKADVLSKYKKALDSLKNAGYTVNYVNTVHLVPWKFITNSDCSDYIFKMLDDAGDLAYKIGNIPEIASNNHWHAVMYSHLGQQKKAMFHYNESNRLRTQLGELIPLIKIRNGLSYEALCRADYIDAFVLLNSMAERIYELKDYASVVNTLKNMALAYFYARHFDEAEEIFIEIIDILHIFDKKKLTVDSFLPAESDIILYKTYIELTNEDYIHSKIHCNNLLRFGNDINPYDRPILNLVRAVFMVKENNIEQAEEVINEAVEYYKAQKSNQDHRIVFIYYEFACGLAKYGQKELSKKYLKLGFKIAGENKFTYYTKGKKSVHIEDYINGTDEFEPLNLNLQYLGERIRKEIIEKELKDKKHLFEYLDGISDSDINSCSAEDLKGILHRLKTLMVNNH